MAFPESFWVAAATAAPVIALANLVTISDSLGVPDLQAMVKRVSPPVPTRIEQQARRCGVLLYSCPFERV